MQCAFDALLEILPPWMRREVDKLGRETLQELRLRRAQEPMLVTGEGEARLGRVVTQEDLNFCVSTASRYSPWAAAGAASGYITAPGGHRIGLCGEAVLQQGRVTGIRELTSLCIRVARDFPGIAAGLAGGKGSVLILGPPGSGKTTLLRDLIRQVSNRGPESVAVVDERGELFPRGREALCFSPGKRTDVLTGCGKAQGLDMALRTMGPGWIAVDEITAGEDAAALLHAGNCGVQLMATAHGADVGDLQRRAIYRPLLEQGLFSRIVVLDRDKSWRLERMCTYP